VMGVKKVGIRYGTKVEKISVEQRGERADISSDGPEKSARKIRS